MSVERSGGLRLLAAAGLAALVAWGGFRAASVKLGQHVVLELDGPLVPQGWNPGDLSGVLAIKADGSGGVVALTFQDPLYRVQHFDGGLVLRAHIDLPSKETGTLTDLAVMPDGGVRLAGQDGSLWVLDSGLRLPRRGFKLATGRSHLQFLDCRPDGRLLAVDPSDSSVVTLDSTGKVLQSLDVAEASGVGAVAMVPEGMAWLESVDGSAWLRVVDLSGNTLRRFPVAGVSWSTAVHVAASGHVLLVNDAGGHMGVVFYSDQGKPLGSSLGAGSYLVVNPGFVGGDPAGGVGYIHFGYGLVRVKLPFKDQG